MTSPGRMRRQLDAAVALAALILAAGLAQAAPWLQSAADAAHTNHVDDEGPSWPDVAWQIELPGPLPFSSTPVVIGATAYVAVASEEPGVYRVDLDTADAALLVPWRGRLDGVASDGTRLFLHGEARVEAYPLDGGEPLWTYEPPPLYGEGTAGFCSDLAVAADALFLPCSVSAAFGYPGTEIVVALDAATGEARWVWRHDLSGAFGAPTAIAYPPMTGTNTYFAYAVPLGGAVVAAGWDSAGRAARGSIWALDRATGVALWNDSTLFATGIESGVVAAPLARAGLHALRPISSPTGTDTVVFMKFGQETVAWNLASGERLWSTGVGQQDVTPDRGLVELALAPDALYVPAHQTLTRLDPVTSATRWQVALDPALGEAWDGWGVVLAQGVLHVLGTDFFAEGDHTAIYAYDAESGDILWRFEAPIEPFSRSSGRFALSDGRILFGLLDGRLLLLGRAEAALAPALDASSRYPAPGEEVEVDLGGTRAGLFGAATAYRADWGDGAVTPWQASPVMRHAYAEAGDHEARFFARNDANQTASEAIVFHVGASEPNAISVAFAPENQDATFFFLGLVLTGAGAGYGAWRVQRKRRVLRAELVAIDAEHAAAGHDVDEQERLLARRRERVRALVAAGRIDEAQAATLDRHITDLVAAARIGAIEADFAFLPYSLVRTLRAMLRDGRINNWERDHIEQALAADATLAAEQKARVRQRLDAWLSADSARR